MFTRGPAQTVRRKLSDPVSRARYLGRLPSNPAHCLGRASYRSQYRAVVQLVRRVLKLSRVRRRGTQTLISTAGQAPLANDQRRVCHRAWPAQVRLVSRLICHRTPSVVMDAQRHASLPIPRGLTTAAAGRRPRTQIVVLLCAVFSRRVGVAVTFVVRWL